MKYLVTICRECIYEVYVRAENEDDAINTAEELFKNNQSSFIPVETIIEPCNIEIIEE